MNDTVTIELTQQEADFLIHQLSLWKGDMLSQTGKDITQSIIEKLITNKLNGMKK